MSLNTMVESKQYVIVTMNSQRFGIDIQSVDSIIRMQRITRVPNTQQFFKGIINLRGEIVPIMSLRTRFNIDEINHDTRTRIIIIKHEGQEPIGIIVDEVLEVYTIDEEHIDKECCQSTQGTYQFISGIAKCNEYLVSILDIAHVIAMKEN